MNQATILLSIFHQTSDMLSELKKRVNPQSAEGQQAEEIYAQCPREACEAKFDKGPECYTRKIIAIKYWPELTPVAALLKRLEIYIEAEQRK